MTSRVSSVGAARSSLERGILEVVAYADVFDFPVTLDEITKALPMAAAKPEVEAALANSGPLTGQVNLAGRFYVLVGQEHLVEVRKRRHESSERLIRTATGYGSLISELPFVRMVAVTGSLAVENADAGDDIDYLIVTTKGRLWLARAMAILIVRLAGLRGVTLCPNYMLSESVLALSERDSYTARELLQMRPIAGHDVYERMLAENEWWRDLLPNWDASIEPTKRRRSFVARLGEVIMGGKKGDALERWLLQRKGNELRAKAGDNSETVFGADICKGHFESHRARLQGALAQRLRRMETQR